MKKYLFLLIAMLMSVSAFTLVGCSSDDDDDNDNPSSSNTIQINGKSYELDTYVVQEGSFDAEAGKGEFTVEVFNQVGNTKDCWFYQFSYTDSTKPKVGDDFSKKALELMAQDDSDAWYTTLTYKSGSAKVVSIDKSKDDMTIKFDNLKMAGVEYSYTFNGTATVDFNFARH